MVRLDKCVEALYDDSVTNDNRNKNLQILSVMKGAISMSRSRTGECIFRTNKAERKQLERVLLCEGRDSHYRIAQIDSKRKQVVMRWSKVLKHQTMCSSEELFEELMEIARDGAEDTHRLTQSESPDQGDGKLRHLIDLRLSAIEKETNAGTYVPVIPARKRRLMMKADDIRATTDNHHTEFVTIDKQIRDKYSDGQTDDKIHREVKDTEATVVDQTKIKLVHLPNIRQGTTQPRSDSPDPSPRPPPPLERDLTDWGNWRLKDKSWIKDYLFREKTRHEDLVIRNALNKIESDLSGANMIKRQQMRQKLQQEKQQREAEIKQHMRAQKLIETSDDSDLTSPRVRKETVTPVVLTTACLENNDSDRNEPTVEGDADVLKQVNFDDNLMVHVFEPSGKRHISTKSKRKPTSRTRLGDKSNARPKLSLPIIPEDAKTSKGDTRRKGQT